MASALLESPSLDALQRVVELARQLGIRIRRVEDDVVPIDREALEQILDQGIQIEDPQSFLDEFAYSREDRSLPFRN